MSRAAILQRLNALYPARSEHGDGILTYGSRSSYNSYIMAVVGVKELKDRLTQYLRRTRQGDEIIVTDRGRAIAVIQSLNQAANLSSLEARLARLDAQGIATAPARRPLRRVRRQRVKGRPLSRVVLDDRR